MCIPIMAPQMKGMHTQERVKSRYVYGGRREDDVIWRLCIPLEWGLRKIMSTVITFAFPEMQPLFIFSNPPLVRLPTYT